MTQISRRHYRRQRRNQSRRPRRAAIRADHDPPLPANLWGMPTYYLITLRRWRRGRSR
jgi:hypothetical protein